MSLLLAISGLDGSGKTTLANGVLARLLDAGYSAESVEAPMSRVWQNTRLLRHAAPELASLGLSKISVAMDLERLEFLQDLVVPLLRLHDVVLLQRYTLDWAAIGMAIGSDPSQRDLLLGIERLLDLRTQCVFLRLPAATAAARLKQRGHSLDPRESLPVLQQTAAAYDALCKAEPHAKVDVLDATLPPAELVEQVLVVVRYATQGARR